MGLEKFWSRKSFENDSSKVMHILRVSAPKRVDVECVCCDVRDVRDVLFHVLSCVKCAWCVMCVIERPSFTNSRSVTWLGGVTAQIKKKNKKRSIWSMIIEQQIHHEESSGHCSTSYGNQTTDEWIGVLKVSFKFNYNTKGSGSFEGVTSCYDT